MQWLPSPPTDNIYKLLAIFGLWLIFGFFALSAVFSYLDYRFHKEMNEASYHSHTEHMIREFSKRLEALERNTPEKNKIPGMTDDFNNDVDFLKNTLAFQEKRFAEYKKREPDNLDTFLDFLLSHETLFYSFIAVYAVITALCTVIGFSRWYKKIQRPSEILNDLDIQLKKASLLKLKMEISQLQPISKTIEQFFELYSDLHSGTRKSI